MSPRRWAILLLLLFAATAGTTSAAAEDEVKLRPWFIGLQGQSGDRDEWNVFGDPDLVPGDLEAPGGGIGLHAGYRFGGRFLLGLQVISLEFEVVDSPDIVRDFSALITGTVLFRERDTFQPFLRGDFGLGGLVVDASDGHTIAMGLAVAAGGGLQVRLSSRFSLEAEVMADFRNFQEVQDNPDDGPETEWTVRTSHMGGRLGLGLLVWF